VVVRVGSRIRVMGWVGILLRQVDGLLLSLIGLVELFEAIRGGIALRLEKLNRIC